MRRVPAMGMLAGVLLLLGSATGSAQDVEEGRRLFVQLGCGFCHEDGGRRPGKGPQLMHSKRDNDYMMNRIATGKPGRMPAFGGSLTAESLDSLIAYIRSLEAAS
jgi:mono/diheme cytochrome c family protein